MMINTNYAEQVALAKSSNISIVNFDTGTPKVQPISGEKDTVTFSDKALAMMQGQEHKEQAPTYLKPVSALSLLATTPETGNIKQSSVDLRFNEMMQDILDQRLGVDREKLKELEAMMEEIASNESMSAEEKAEALELLGDMREKIIKESIELKEVAQQTD